MKLRILTVLWNINIFVYLDIPFFSDKFILVLKFELSKVLFWKLFYFNNVIF